MDQIILMDSSIVFFHADDHMNTAETAPLRPAMFKFQWSCCGDGWSLDHWMGFMESVWDMGEMMPGLLASLIQV